MATTVSEFEEKDYEQARNTADAVYTNATNIKNIFEDINNTMNMLYNTNWISDGANAAQAEYFKQFKAKYDGFYQKVVDMKTHVYAVTAANETADAQALNVIGG